MFNITGKDNVSAKSSQVEVKRGNIGKSLTNTEPPGGGVFIKERRL